LEQELDEQPKSFGVMDETSYGWLMAGCVEMKEEKLANLNEHGISLRIRYVVSIRKSLGGNLGVLISVKKQAMKGENHIDRYRRNKQDITWPISRALGA
jgi:hypothetical protein